VGASVSNQVGESHATHWFAYCGIGAGWCGRGWRGHGHCHTGVGRADGGSSDAQHLPRRQRERRWRQQRMGKHVLKRRVGRTADERGHRSRSRNRPRPQWRLGRCLDQRRRQRLVPGLRGRPVARPGSGPVDPGWSRCRYTGSGVPAPLRQSGGGGWSPRSGVPTCGRTLRYRIQGALRSGAGCASALRSLVRAPASIWRARSAVSPRVTPICFSVCAGRPSP